MKSTGYVLCEKPSVGIEPTRLTDKSRFENHGTYTSITDVQLTSGSWVASYDGIASKITVGDLAQNIQTFMCWIYADAISRAIVDFDSGTHSVEIDATPDVTATGWATPTIYVNGSSASATVAISTWYHIAVTTATPFDANAVVLGDEATFWDGYLSLSKILNYALSADQIYTIYQKERGYFGV